MAGMAEDWSGNQAIKRGRRLVVGMADNELKKDVLFSKQNWTFNKKHERSELVFHFRLTKNNSVRTLTLVSRVTCYNVSHTTYRDMVSRTTD